MKIVTVVGARPQFVKAATVSRVISERDDIEELIVHTGQHFDRNMSDIFFKQLSIPEPDYNLGIGGGSHGSMTGRQLEAIERVLEVEKPNQVLVYGDTNSTLAGALAASKLHIPVAHVEAGLRSFNRLMPEEINRVLTDHISTQLFAPTSAAEENLHAEGIKQEQIILVGDVMYDAALFYQERAVRPEWANEVGLTENQYILCTVHRAENTDSPERLRSIFRGLEHTGQVVLIPMHPRTKEKIEAYGIKFAKNLLVVPPVSYFEMIWLQMNCVAVATDSGGMQKEAYFQGRPCITLREETEWIELVRAKCNVLVGSSSDKISYALGDLSWMGWHNDPIYGAGTAAHQVVDWITGIEI